MDNIYEDNSNLEEIDNEDEIYQKTSQNDSNSMIFNGNNYINNEDYYKNEFIDNGNNKICFYNFGNKKPHNIIDYLNINSDEYKKYKLYQKVKSMLINLKPLSKAYVEEICHLSWIYSKKLSHKKLSTIVPIIVYKIIKKYNIETISLKDLKKKINFSYKAYFQNEKLFTELNANLNLNKNKSKDSIYKITYNLKTQSYSELVYNSVIKYIKAIKEKSQSSLNIIKIKGKKSLPKNNKNKLNDGNKEENNKIIEELFKKLSKEEQDVDKLYCSPFIFELNNCQKQCKIFIYNNKRTSSDYYIDKSMKNNKLINLKEENEDETILSDENKFNEYFKNKIGSDILGLGMIKYFIDKNNVIILSYKILRELFNCNIYQVKKSILYIKLYANYINNI